MEVLLYVDPVEVTSTACSVIRDVARRVKELLQVDRPVAGAPKVAKKKLVRIRNYRAGTRKNIEEGRYILASVKLFSVDFNIFAHPCHPFNLIVYHNVAVAVFVNPDLRIPAINDDFIDLSI